MDEMISVAVPLTSITAMAPGTELAVTAVLCVVGLFLLLFAIVRNWYVQTMLAAVAIGSLLSLGCAVLRLFDRRSANDWPGVILLCIGLVGLLATVITVRKLFPDFCSPKKTGAEIPESQEQEDQN